jgi:glycine cleavage system H protein
LTEWFLSKNVNSKFWYGAYGCRQNGFPFHFIVDLATIDTTEWNLICLYIINLWRNVMEKSRRYAKSHEWARLEDDGTVTVGISAYAVEALTDLVFMQLPDVGATVTAGESFGEIESVKAVSDLYAPISGKVVAANTDLPSQLETLGSDPYGSGWVIRIEPDSVEQLEALMNQEAYDELIGG